MAIDEGDSYDLTVTKGRVFRERFYSREDDEETVLPFPPGSTASAEIRNRPGGDLLTAFACVLDEDEAFIEISLTAAQTRALPHNAVYDVKVMPGETKFVGVGKVTVEQAVTA